MIIFENPEYLSLLLVLPLIAFFHIVSTRSLKKRAIKFANFEAISKIRGVELFSKNLFPFYFYMVIVILIVLSLSGLSVTYMAETSEIPFVIALDVSRSMGANDLIPNRLQVAKEAARDFLDIIPEKTKVGLVTFSSAPYIKSELTNNPNKLKDIIDNIVLSDFGGTDVLNSIMTGSSLMFQEEGGSIILISDGRVNVNSVGEIIDYSNSKKIVVHTMSVGTEQGGEGELGGYYRGSKENLHFIAENTGGQYFDIEEKTDFYSSFNQILRIEKKKEILNLSPYLLMGSILALLIFYVFYHSRYRMLP